jgi:hypothetical protein
MWNPWSLDLEPKTLVSTLASQPGENMTFRCQPPTASQPWTERKDRLGFQQLLGWLLLQGFLFLSLHFSQPRLLSAIICEVAKQVSGLDRGPEVWPWWAPPSQCTSGPLFLFLVVWRLAGATWGSSELNWAFSVFLTWKFGSLVWRLFWVLCSLELIQALPFVTGKFGLWGDN